MSAPDPLREVAGMCHCVRNRDYAGAVRRVAQPVVLDAIADLAGYAERQRALADEARREAAAVLRAEAEQARLQASVGPLLEELIGVLADALGVGQRPVCISCKRSMGKGYRNCPYCGTRDARSAGWPARKEAAA